MANWVLGAQALFSSPILYPESNFSPYGWLSGDLSGITGRKEVSFLDLRGKVRIMTGMEGSMGSQPKNSTVQSVVHESVPDCNEVNKEVEDKCFKAFIAT